MKKIIILALLALTGCTIQSHLGVGDTILIGGKEYCIMPALEILEVETYPELVPEDKAECNN